MCGGRLQRLVSFVVLFEWEIEGSYHFGPLVMFSNTGRGESGAGRELTCQSWLRCGVWGRVSGWKGLRSTELFKTEKKFLPFFDNFMHELFKKVFKG